MPPAGVSAAIASQATGKLVTASLTPPPTPVKAPSSDDLQLWLALARERLGQQKTVAPKGECAAYWYKKVLAADPRNEKALEGLSIVEQPALASARKRLDGGIDDVRQAIAMFEGLVEYFGNLEAEGALEQARSRLATLERLGRLELTVLNEEGNRAFAVVTINGRNYGKPSRGDALGVYELEPGTYPIRVELPPFYGPWDGTAAFTAGQTEKRTVRLGGK